LFTETRFTSTSYIPHENMNLQLANNCAAIAEMVGVAKDAIIDQSSNTCAICKESYFQTLAKVAKVR